MARQRLVPERKSLPVVVSSSVGCGRDLVSDGDNGFIVPTSNAEALSGALAEILDDPARADEMGRRSLAIVRRWGYDFAVEQFALAIQCALG